MTNHYSAGVLYLYLSLLA